MAVYILKYHHPLGKPSKPYASARYYVGYADDERVQERIDEHRRGVSGAVITRHFFDQGIDFDVVTILPGLDRSDERRIKDSGNYARFENRTRPYRRIK